MALAKELESFLDCFEGLEDPRVERTRLHPMPEILLTTVCGVIAGCEGWNEIEEFGRSRLEWLRQYLAFDNGIPSDDTLRRFFRALDPKSFQRCFQIWCRQWFTLPEQAQIAIDGKTLRGSRDGDKKALHLVSAFATEARIVLAQQPVSEKSNEMTAIPELLAVLELKGATVSIDAMGCQHAIAQQIVEGGGDYVLGLKGNQGQLHEDVKTFFETPLVRVEFDHDEQHDKGHGRIETRRASCTDQIDWLRERHPQFASMGSIIKVESWREIGEQIQTETRYYIASFAADAPRSNHSIREHWSIENGLHWVLDMSFGEDQSRIRKGHAVANLAVIRHVVLNVLQTFKGKRDSIKRLRRRAGWEPDFLQTVLGAMI